MRLVAAIALLTLLAPLASAADQAAVPAPAPAAKAAPAPTPAAMNVEKEYMDRLLAMDDTAGAHVAMAKWCASNGLAERAKVHWREALLRDADNAEARAAAGFVKRNNQWVPAAEAKAEPAGKETPAVDPTLAERTRALAQEVRDILRQYLIPTEDKKWVEGRRRLMAIADPAAADSIGKLLGASGDVEVRSLACEALAQVPCDLSLRYLLGFYLGDASSAVSLQALEGLKRQPDDRILQQLIWALTRGTKPVMERAAYALGELGNLKAVPALISHLRAPEQYKVLVKEMVEPSHSMSGNVTAYVAGLEPIVAGGVVAYKPIVGYVGGGSGLGASTPQEVTTEKTKTKMVEQPAVLEALKQITGMDYGYRTQDWWSWLARQQAAEKQKEMLKDKDAPALPAAPAATTVPQE
jgi:hypothetical protein